MTAASIRGLDSELRDEGVSVAPRSISCSDGKPYALLAALELVARDVKDWRAAQDAWLARQAPHSASAEAYGRLFDDLELLERVARRSRPWSVVLELSAQQLRSLAEAAVQP